MQMQMQMQTYVSVGIGTVYMNFPRKNHEILCYKMELS